MGTKAIFFLCITCLFCGLAYPHRQLLQDAAAPTIFDVTTFGALSNNDTFDNAQPFMQAWIQACKNSTTPAKVLIPNGVFLTGPTVFGGPCTSPKPIILEVVGTIKATTDPSEYVSPEWVAFEDIDGLVVTGNGTFDGQGSSVWQYNDCRTNPNCVNLPSSLQFSRVNNTIVKDITSLNSKQFHYHLHKCYNFSAWNLNITAPKNSPNTDGMHVGSSDEVNVTSSVIGTGDDCISIGQGTTNVYISNITCGPGHGISVGSLGKRPLDKSVSGISVKNCTFIGTTNGARIKTYIGKSPGEAKGIVYEGLIMDNVQNPIVIDQSYGSKKVRQASVSLWKISDVHFRGIKGTTVSNVALSLQCSVVNPCQGVEVADVDLSFSGTQRNTTFVSSCANTPNATFTGTINPPPCL
ncbi:exopolygalacturonase [Senna tora]|uniref:Exopolygalacturonase n=1 Tax=Senna tora TaxID=362788 RepID=A0A834WD54_9FABA|nr:exopolygalacturonase [Senna tora]